jgi:hypothetical protein
LLIYVLFNVLKSEEFKDFLFASGNSTNHWYHEEERHEQGT